MYIANNSLSASIPTSLCNATYLYALDLSYNRLSGSIPSCVLEIIWLLDLSQNNINRSIPDNFPVDCKLQYFDLNNNTLEGEIPKSLERCRSLEFMNIGNNNIKDTFPCMLSSSLRVLVMHSNSFYREVRCHKSWTDLQVLDISLNHFGGSLESIDFSSWRAMVQQSEQLRHHTTGRMILRSNGKFWEAQSLSVTLIMKGMNLELHKIWPNFGSIDCSSNEFYGEIPNAIGDLTSLYHLNFSHNALNGSIPNSFGQLKNLESLDLSVNQLVGLIPEELEGLTFLSKLNLSYNKFVGAIPKGRQIQTFLADSFEGNSRLCGFPLDINCSNTNVPPPGYDENGEEKKEIEWKYVCAAVGYVVGVGSIVWLLLFCRSFIEKYFGKIEEVVEDMFIARECVQEF